MAAFVSTTDAAGNGTADPITLAFAANVTSGNLLIATFKIDSDSVTITSVTDSLHGAAEWTLAVTNPMVAATIQDFIYYKIATASGACTVSIDLSGSATYHLQIAEFSPTAGFTWTGVDVTGVQDNASDTTHESASPALTSTRANGVWISGMGYSSAYSVNGGELSTDYSPTVAPARHHCYYRITTATQTSDGDWTTLASETGAAVLAFLYETDGGGGTAAPRPSTRIALMGVGW